MSSLASRPVQRPRCRPAPSPAQAGFRPAAAALAVATAFALHGLPARAQPVPKAVIHGTASFAAHGGNLVVTTTNGPGTHHSAIDWSSFSVPTGTITRFVQPSASSLSINRVVDANPSRIFGRLASNGALVLVNPWGITVGQGAQVDTAAFTASTLAMSDADALAGRLRFAGDGAALRLDGAIRSRGGDVVLVAPQVRAGAPAVIESRGAVVLAAGRKVEITGRGLEGIHMEVQAGNEAVNLGSLRGDAVGMFAGTLHHSGLVQAQAVSTEGGKVVLEGGGRRDRRWPGAGAGRGRRGRTHRRVRRACRPVSPGPGSMRAGRPAAAACGWAATGRAATPRCQNAQVAYVDAGASIRADATEAGDGGRVIVWSDQATRMHGRISARGGAGGGDGGFVETVRQAVAGLHRRSRPARRAGRSGTLLLDPGDLTIVKNGPNRRRHRFRARPIPGSPVPITGPTGCRRWMPAR